jgi:hypothetical protein
LLQSGVRIIGSVRASKLAIGEKRAPLGTGFFITVPSETVDGMRYGYVLTAHHILWDQNRIEIQASNPTTNGELHPPLEINDWRQPLHNVDLAVAPFNPDPNSGRFYQSLELERHVLPVSKLPALGSTVYYVGILIPLDRPMARAGTIGAVDQRGIEHDGGYEYPAHLVDCRSYGGFSGSPCFVELAFGSLTPIANPFTDINPGPVGNMNYTTLLCGMFTQHLSDSETSVVSRYGVGTMLRSNEIWEALMNDKMRKERRTWDAENEAATEAADEPRLKGASAEVSDEFERFEDLTRVLVNTPKSEVDEKRKAGQ